MPNLMDILNGLGTPTVPKRAISGLQNAMAPGSDAPLPQAEPNMLLDMLGLNQPWDEVGGALSDLSGLSLGDLPEAAGGFLSGALEGGRNLTSPSNLAAMLPAVGAFRGLGKVAPRAAQAAETTIDYLDNIPTPQISPGMGEARDLMWELQENMNKVPNATGQMRRPSVPSLSGGPNPAQGLQSAAPKRAIPSPEFAGMGEEAAYNMGRLGLLARPAAQPIDAAFDRYQYRSRGGR